MNDKPEKKTFPSCIDTTPILNDSPSIMHNVESPFRMLGFHRRRFKKGGGGHQNYWKNAWGL
jgi:hypothetical protein